MHIFRVSFVTNGKVYEVYAESVRQAELFGFIEVADLVFGENSSLVLDPAEERLKTEFSGVSRTLVPINAVLRIDEVEKRGPSKIADLELTTNVHPFPSPFLGPRGRD